MKCYFANPSKIIINRNHHANNHKDSEKYNLASKATEIRSNLAIKPAKGGIPAKEPIPETKTNPSKDVFLPNFHNGRIHDQSHPLIGPMSITPKTQNEANKICE